MGKNSLLNELFDGKQLPERESDSKGSFLIEAFNDGAALPAGTSAPPGGAACPGRRRGWNRHGVCSG